MAAALEYAGVVRQTMSQENRDELDRLNLKFYRAWLKLFGIEYRVYRPRDEAVRGQAELTVAKQCYGPTGEIYKLFLRGWAASSCAQARDITEPNPTSTYWLV